VPLTSQLCAAGVWPAVLVVGYLVFARNRCTGDRDALPLPTSIALMITAGLAAWSVPLLAAAIAGVYQPAHVGVAAWIVVLVGGPTLMYERRGHHANGARRVAGQAEAATVQRTRSTGPGSAAASNLHGSTVMHVDRLCDGLLVAGLLLAGVLYFGFPSESIYGGRDEGVYANHAVYLAHHGRLTVPYPWAAEDSDVLSHWTGFPGFYNTPETLTVQFGHLFPVWLAQAYATAGPNGLFRFNGAVSLLSLVLFYGVCRMAVPGPLALTATLFLAFNPSQLWIARITLSEPLAQMFIWAGLVLLMQALRDHENMSARWAGGLLGLSVLVRIDGLTMMPLLFLSHLVWKLFVTANMEATEPRCGIWSAVYQTAVPVAALALATYAFTCAPYLREVAAIYMWPLVTASVITLGLLLIGKQKLLRRLSPALTGKVSFGILAATIAAASGYATWWRPRANPDPQWKFERVGYSFDAARDYAQDSFVNLARYLSPFVLGLALAGWLAVLWRRIRRDRDYFFVPVVVIVGCWSVVCLWRPGVYPDHFWAIRRFVPVVIPGVVLCAAIAAAEIARRLSRLWTYVLGGATVLFLVGFTFQAGRLVFFFAEDQGLYAQLQAVAERLPRDQVIITHGYKTWVTPLYLAFDRQVVPIDISAAEGAMLWRQWAARQKGRGQPAYLLVEIDKPSAERSKVVDEFVLSRVFVQPTVYPLPTQIVRSQWQLELYKFPP